MRDWFKQIRTVLEESRHSGGPLRARSLEAFRMLYQPFQMTVTDVSKIPTLPITISKPSG